jgi:hypothetical protein
MKSGGTDGIRLRPSTTAGEQSMTCRTLAAALVAIAAANGTMAAELESFASADPALRLGSASFAGGKTLQLSVGIGSGAFHAAGDPADVIYTLSDRGPNIDCGDAEAIAGVSAARICQGEKTGKVFPAPSFAPSIYRVEIGAHGSFAVAEVIPLKASDGQAITGLPNPLTVTNTEPAFDAAGKKIALDPSGLDTEALVRLSDGRFWLTEEYGPSLIHVAADGTVLERLVPAGVERDLAGARYPVAGTLPAVLMRRALNRGIESLALSPDEKFLYFIVQSPLANPDADAYKKSRQARLFKFDLARRTAVAEYVYLLDLPQSFAKDKSEKQNDVRLSEMVALGPDDLVVLERISKTTKLHRLSLAGATNILGTAWDDPATAPSLEQLKADDLAAQGISPVGKTLWFDGSALDLPSKIEGVALADDSTLWLINDDDFGIEGATTKIVRAAMPATN